MPRRHDDEDFDDEDYEEEDDRPRRRARPPEGDATGGLIPYKNAKALTASESRWQRARDWLTAAITSTRPEIRVEQEGAGPGRFTVAFPMVRTERDVTRLANELFALPGRIASERRRSVVIALGESPPFPGPLYCATAPAIGGRYEGSRCST